MSYYVYENSHADEHKAKIHKSECGNCKYGKGKSGQGTRIDRGKWHGPFDTYEDALQTAKNTEGKVSDGECCLR